MYLERGVFGPRLLRLATGRGGSDVLPSGDVHDGHSRLEGDIPLIDGCDDDVTKRLNANLRDRAGGNVGCAEVLIVNVVGLESQQR